MGVKGSQFTTAIYTPLKRSYIDSSSSYCTTYGNWVKILDPATDKYTWTPFSGFAAAIYCNTDASGHPWDAPAGLNRGVVTNINDIAFNPNQKQRDYLYTIAVNPVVYFTGDGYTVYGQKTLQTKPSAFDRLNVRRLFLALERATVSVAKYFVFEPNTEITRSRFRNTLTPIFELAKQTQGLYDYLIVCDDRNNTPANIDSNELVVDIYIKPVRTAEFILINFIATRTSQNFQELI
jgi:phage tail sheath protein FI